jgi:hypothetical protein
LANRGDNGRQRAGRLQRAASNANRDSAAAPLDVFSPTLLIKCGTVPAGVGRDVTRTQGEQTMRYRIEFADDLMHVLDENGNGHDALVIRRDNAKDAEAKIDEWAAEYKMDARRAKRELRDLIRRM